MRPFRWAASCEGGMGSKACGATSSLESYHTAGRERERPDLKENEIDIHSKVTPESDSASLFCSIFQGSLDIAKSVYHTGRAVPCQCRPIPLGRVDPSSVRPVRGGLATGPADQRILRPKLTR